MKRRKLLPIRCGKHPLSFLSLAVAFSALAPFFAQFSACLAQGNNPAGMAVRDPRFPLAPFAAQSPASTTGHALDGMGIRLAPSSPKHQGRIEDASIAEWPDQNQALFLAAGGGSIEELVALVRAGANVDFRDPGSGMTPLMTVRTRIQAAVLLAAGADPDLRDSEGLTALHHALFADEAVAIVRLLLAAGADVNVVAGGGEQETPLLAARGLFYEGRDPAAAEPIIRLLMEAGATLDARDAQGATLLMTLVERRQRRLVRALLSLGADPNLRNAEGVSALDMAMRLGDEGMKAVLMGAGTRK